MNALTVTVAVKCKVYTIHYTIYTSCYSEGRYYVGVSLLSLKLNLKKNGQMIR